MIDLYLKRGDLYVLFSENEPVSLCVVTEENDTTLELKNLATQPSHQKKGYATKLISYIENQYKGKYKTLFVGTGEVPSILHFYEKCGFTISHREVDFFTKNYDLPMIEEGVLLKDMIYLKKEI